MPVRLHGITADMAFDIRKNSTFEQLTPTQTKNAPHFGLESVPFPVQLALG